MRVVWDEPNRESNLAKHGLHLPGMDELPAGGAWLLAAVAFVLVRPDVTRRAGDRLTAEEGLAGSGETVR